MPRIRCPTTCRHLARGRALDRQLAQQPAVALHRHHRQEQLRRISQLRTPINWVAEAPLGIAIVLDGANAAGEAYDEGRVTERLLIAARSLGLGGGVAWYGDADQQAEGKRILGIPAERTARSVVIVGYPTSVKDPRPNAARPVGARSCPRSSATTAGASRGRERRSARPRSQSVGQGSCPWNTPVGRHYAGRDQAVGTLVHAMQPAGGPDGSGPGRRPDASPAVASPKTGPREGLDPMARHAGRLAPCVLPRGGLAPLRAESCPCTVRRLG
jgi:hypothetical protein